MDALAAYLKERGITQMAFAEKLRVSQPTVNRWIRGTQKPCLQKAAEIDRETGGMVPMSAWFDQEAAE